MRGYCRGRQVSLTSHPFPSTSCLNFPPPSSTRPLLLTYLASRRRHVTVAGKGRGGGGVTRGGRGMEDEGCVEREHAWRQALAAYLYLRDRGRLRELRL